METLEKLQMILIEKITQKVLEILNFIFLLKWGTPIIFQDNLKHTYTHTHTQTHKHTHTQTHTHTNKHTLRINNFNFASRNGN